MSYNKVILVGNAVDDVVTRFTSQQKQVADLRLAVNNRGKDALFINVTLWDKNAEVAGQYVKKGKQVLVDGRLNCDNWTDKEGQKHTKFYITCENLRLLGTKSTSNQNHQSLKDSPDNPPTDQSDQIDPNGLTVDENIASF